MSRTHRLPRFAKDRRRADAMHRLQIGLMDRNVDGVGTHGRSVVRSPHLRFKTGHGASRSLLACKPLWPICRQIYRPFRCTAKVYGVFVRARLNAGASRAASKASPGGLLVALPKRSVGVHCWRSGVDRSAARQPVHAGTARLFTALPGGRPAHLRARTPACGISRIAGDNGWTPSPPLDLREASPCGRDATIGSIPTSSNEISAIIATEGLVPATTVRIGIVMPLVPFVVDSSEPAARPFRRHVGKLRRPPQAAKRQLGRRSCAHYAAVSRRRH